MPNWVENHLHVEEDIIKEITTNGEIDFNKIVLKPKELEGTISPPQIVPDEDY